MIRPTLYFVFTLLEFIIFTNPSATTEIYTLSLHDALPISMAFTIAVMRAGLVPRSSRRMKLPTFPSTRDRKSTRLNSSHLVNSYAVFCLKKKSNHTKREEPAINIDKEG